ncbi:hypothetical protein Tco_0536264 [Tanacetum coccineum]
MSSVRLKLLSCHFKKSKDAMLFARLWELPMSAAVERGHNGDGGGDDPSRPPPRPIGTSCRGVGGRKATRGGGIDGGSNGTRKETRNLGLKIVVDEYGPLKIRFEFNDKGTMLHLARCPGHSKCSKPGKEHGLLPAEIPLISCPLRLAGGDVEAEGSRVLNVIFIDDPRGTYTDAGINEMKEEDKAGAWVAEEGSQE